jgi:ABC-type uncharacterized transport system auxiliary subunit
MPTAQMETAGAKNEAARDLRRISQIAAVSLVVAMAAACSATHPTIYYALDTPAPAPAPAPGIESRTPVRLIVGRVTGSRLYHDNRLVYGTGTVELGTYEYQRWAEPPVDYLQDILVTSLRASGQYRSVSRIGSNARGDYVVRGHLDALDEIDKPALAARFTFQLELFDPASGSTVWSSSYSHDEPVQGKKVTDVVEALNRNVEAGLRQLTTELNQYLASHVRQESAGD